MISAEFKNLTSLKLIVLAEEFHLVWYMLFGLDLHSED